MLGLLFLVLALWPVPSSSADEYCVMCHRDVAQGGLMHRAHGLGPDPKGEQPTVGCTGCHGPSEEHVRSPSVAPSVAFSADTPADAARAACMSCHSDAVSGHWHFSAHAAAELSCTSCHTLHSATDPVQERLGQFQVCTDCHVQEKAGQMRFSRHPMREGLIQCTDCHAPHGGAGMNELTQATINDTCYQCHAEKRGPFLFEHEPVQDDCTHCHLPHDSVNDNLLKARQPMLCQQCHIAARHPGTYYDSRTLTERNINIAGQSCTNCHSQVHGGNHPVSQTFRR